MSAWIDLPRLLPRGESTAENVVEQGVENAVAGMPGLNRSVVNLVGSRLTSLSNPLGAVDESTGILTNPMGDVASFWGGPYDRAYDAAVEQPAYAEDSADILGPSANDVLDVVVQTDGEGDAPQERWMLTAAVVVVVAGAALWLLGPLFEVVAAVAGGEG